MKWAGEGRGEKQRKGGKDCKEGRKGGREAREKGVRKPAAWKRTQNLKICIVVLTFYCRSGHSIKICQVPTGLVLDHFRGEQQRRGLHGPLHAASLRHPVAGHRCIQDPETTVSERGRERGGRRGEGRERKAGRFWK